MSLAEGFDPTRVESDDYVPPHTLSWDASKRAEFVDYVQRTEAVPSQAIAHEGAQAVLEQPKGRAFAEIGKGKKAKLQKAQVALDGLVDEPFGGVYIMEGGKLKRHCVRPESGTQILDPTYIPSANNSELFDNANNQKLSQSDIEKLKEEKSGAELVQLVIENSSTFKSKTEFSQEKYLKRKKKKYGTEMRLLPPTLLNMCETYFNKTPKKTMFMRADTLSQILTFANVRAHAQTIVVESCAGLVTAGVAQRQGGFGHVLSAYDDSYPSPLLLQKYDLSEAEHKSIVHWPLWLTNTAVASIGSTASSSSTVSSTSSSSSSSSETEPMATDEKEEKHKKARDADSERAKALLPQLSDSLIIVTHYDPETTLFGMLPLLASSGSFVVYSQHVESLLACLTRLRRQGLAINLTVCESWYREYQVLPNRTHPFMNMSAFGGYLLAGTKVT